MDLVPNIAFGDLAESSLAEVVAAAFRANASGVVAVEQGRGESRIYVRYGCPCGTALYTGFKSFAEFLVDLHVIDADSAGRLAAAASQRGVEFGDLLASERIITPARAVELATAYHHDALVSLCVLREGKYELRGWEPPPEWTEAIRLDPLHAIVTALRTDELFDRRQAVLGNLGDRTLRLADDFDELLGKLFLDASEEAALRKLTKPVAARAFMASLGREDAEAALVAYGLLGLVDEWVAPRPSVPAPASVSPRSRPPSGPESQAGYVIPTSEQMLSVPPYDSVSGETSGSGPSSSRWLSAMASQLDVALTPSPELAAPVPAAEGTFDLTDPADTPTRPHRIAPDSQSGLAMAAKPEQPASRREIEFEPVGDDSSLELDLKRAPVELLRDRLEQGAAQWAKPKGTKVPIPSAARPATAGRGPTSQPGAGNRARRPRADEYNPFWVHFRQVGSAAAVAEPVAHADRTEPNARPVLTAVEPVSQFPEPELTPDSLPMLELDSHGRGRMKRAPESVAPTPREDSGSDDAEVPILEAIESSIGYPSDESPMAPLSIADQGAPLPGEGDQLALEAAREQELASGALEVEPDSVGSLEAISIEPLPSDSLAEPAVTFHPPVHQEAPPRAPEPVSPPEPVQAAEPAFEEVPPAPPAFDEGPRPVAAPTPRSFPPVTPAPRASTGSQESGADVRRRLLQRAMRSVGGPFTAREVTPGVTGVRAPDPVAARPASADVEIERDLREQLAKAAVATHFELLNVPQNASSEQVKDAFLPLAKKYHPDRLSSQGQTHLLEPARQLFARIKEAYDVLLDPVSRAKYLNELEARKGGKKLSTDDARTGYRRALDYLKRRKFAEAEAELVRSIDADPQPDYLAELAWTLLSNAARRDEAADQIISLSARSLKDPLACSDRVYIVAAHVARMRGDQEKSERYFREALEKNPKNVEAAREVRLIESRRAEKPKGGLFDRFRKK